MAEPVAAVLALSLGSLGLRGFFSFGLSATIGLPSASSFFFLTRLVLCSPLPGVVVLVGVVAAGFVEEVVVYD